MLRRGGFGQNRGKWEKLEIFFRAPEAWSKAPFQGVSKNFWKISDFRNFSKIFRDFRGKNEAKPSLADFWREKGPLFRGKIG